MAPPCEKPARTTLSTGTPRPASRAISFSTSATEARTPAASCRCARSKPAMSYQARISKPLLTVTGRIAACGNTKRNGGQPDCSNCGRIGTKSLPSAPSPCNQITLWVGCGAVSRSMHSSMMATGRWQDRQRSNNRPDPARVTPPPRAFWRLPRHATWLCCAFCPEPPMRRPAIVGLAALLSFAAANVGAASPADAPTAGSTAPPGRLTLEQIVADPDWIGPSVEDAYWSVDGRSVYFKLKRKGSSIRDLYRVDAGGGAPVKLDDAQLAQADDNAVFDRAHRSAAFLRHGDVFVRDVASGATRQLTRSDSDKSGLQFSADGHLLSWRDGDDWMVCDLASGTVGPAADLKADNDPDDKQPDQMTRLQLHLFSTLRGIKADKDAQQQREQQLDRDDPSRASEPFYLGDQVKVDFSSLSPDARWMVVATSPKDYDSGK